MIALLRECRWLTRERVAAWGMVLLIEQLFVFAFIALWQHGVFVEVGIPVSSDFVSFYAAGKLALAGTPALAYDQAVHYLAQQRATVPGASYQFFFYPPVFLLLCSVLATLPYLVAFVSYQAVTLAAFLIVMRGVLRMKGWGWVAPVLAFPPVFWNAGVGQNAFLIAALFGGFTLLIDRRPVAAGALLGMLCVKPHIGLLAPLALMAGGRWRALLAAVATAAVMVGLSVLLFGWRTWQAFFAAIAGSGAIYQSGRIDFAGMISVFGGARLMGFAAVLAYAVQATIALSMAALIAPIWRRAASLPPRAASLLASTLLAVPLVLLYDELLALVAIGWLVREAGEHGFLPWEKFILLTIYPLSLLTWTIGTAWHVPLGPAIGLTILVLCLRRLHWTAHASGRRDEVDPTVI
jgi:alpha-1,2-mannosyltransferase